MPAPSETQARRHYVYEHRDPRDNRCLYVGHGHGGRPWAYDAGGRTPTSNPMRNPAHATHLEALLDAGYGADRWVRIVASGLSAGSARAIERVLIAEYEPLYNVQGRRKSRIPAANDNPPAAISEVA